MPAPHSAFTDDQFRLDVEALRDHYWTLARNLVVERHLRAIGAGMDGPILDVGCGRGIAVELLGCAGFQLIGCDPGRPEPISEEVAPRLLLGVEVSDLPAPLRESIRVAMLLDVVEHVDDAAVLLRGVVEALPRVRALLVTVPARRELWTNFDDHYGHRIRFDFVSMRRLASEAGLRLAACRYFFHSLYLPMLAVARLRGERDLMREDRPLARRGLHRFLGRLLAAEERVLPGRLPGTSLLAILEVAARTSPSGFTEGRSPR